MGLLLEVAGFVVIALMVAAVLLRAVWRARRMAVADGPDRTMAVYRDQLKEVERDLARGTLAPEEAGRIKLEISRRILDLDRDAASRRAGTPAPAPMRWVAIGVLVVAILGSGALYLTLGAFRYPDMPLAQRYADAAEARATRPDQAMLEDQFAARLAGSADFPGRDELEPMVAQLRAALVDRPQDVTGHALLAQNEARLGNYRAAIDAQTRLIEIQGDAANAEDYAYLLDLMVIAAGGFVSPEAEALIETLLRRDAQNPVALYYSGRLYAQTGRPDLTFRIWRRLHDISAGDAPWMDELRGALPELARISGEPRYTLPPRPAPTGARGPSAADIEAAQDLDPEARAAMVESMVDGLLARLANDGGSAQDWAQLIRALGVLDRRDQALDILQEARTVFAPRPDDLAVINDAAAAAGLSTPAP